MLYFQQNPCYLFLLEGQKYIIYSVILVVLIIINAFCQFTDFRHWMWSEIIFNLKIKIYTPFKIIPVTKIVLPPTQVINLL